MSPLDRKLFRMLSRMRGQVTAIVLVIALGVMMLVMMTGLVTTLEQTRTAYYDQYRLAEVFAPAARAPNGALQKLAELPGVSAVEGRVTGGALISLDTDERPIRAQAISIPTNGRPRINDYLLTEGRNPDGDRAEEILVLEGFARAHNLAPGDSFAATMNGARRVFKIVGLAQSPEFLYTSAPGELVPDDSRFAVLWMSQSALEAAFDMKGAFNEALFLLSRDARVDEVINGADNVLDPYGGLGAYSVADQGSNRFVSEEIAGLQTTTTVVPPIFLGVAAFLLYIVVARIVQSEREQIGILKAFGYSSVEISLHYFKLVLIIAVVGALFGSALGLLAGRALSGVYQVYYKFPFLEFRVDPGAFALGLTTSVAAASAGALIVLRSVFSLTPAVAMRPPAPADYSRAGSFAPWVRRVLDQPSRMVLRRILRQPLRMAGAVAGIACGMALSVGMVSVIAGFDRTIDLTFSTIDRSDAMISFIHPLSDRVQYDIESMDGVISTEPVRVVPATLNHGLREYRGSINGLIPDASLYRALGTDFEPVPLHTDGIVLSSSLSRVLDAGVGDILRIDVLEGRRPVIELPVTGVAETLLGSPAYMSLDALNRALGEPGRISAIYIKADPDALPDLQRRLGDMPGVAGISVKNDALGAMQQIMDEGAGSMRYVMAAIAAVITFGIIYNSARIAFAERARDLASLRVIGFTRGEAAFVLLGELAIVVLLALPIGAVLGYFLTFAISAGFSTDIYQIPSVFSPGGYGLAAVSVLLASIVSGWIVKKDADRIDLVSALKIRE